MTCFTRPEHRAVAKALQCMDRNLLLQCRCWFAGGTEIVLDLGEYRLSKYIDFLCADAAGYHRLRSLAVTGGVPALFGAEVQEKRAFRSDQYGIRGVIQVDDIPLRFEINREARITLDGYLDPGFAVPRLMLTDRVAEKLLANADRCQDLSTGFRDAIDLGMLAMYRGPLPEAALEKAEAAYGEDVMRKIAWVLGQLSVSEKRAAAADTLGMHRHPFDAAAGALAGEFLCLRPGALSGSVPPHPRATHMVDVALGDGAVSIRRRPAVGQLPAVLDNPLGPALVTPDGEIYALNGVVFAGREAWQAALSQDTAIPEQ